MEQGDLRVGGDSGGGGGVEGGRRDMNEQSQPQPPPPQQPQPQRCPRCESVITKFCYYNNYSLSQPRYFCKTCRRYWTQGGTLRNVPVGGGCQKGKRTKTTASSSADNCRSQLQFPLKEVVPTQPNLTSTVIRPEDPYAAVGPSPTVPSITPFYQGGGYLSSRPAIQSLNPSQPFNPSLNLEVDALSSSNLGLLSGFNAASVGSQRHLRPSQNFQTGNREREVESLYTAEQGSIQTSMMSNRNSASRNVWSETFIASTHNRASDSSLWSTVSTTSVGDESESIKHSTGSSLLMSNKRPDPPGHGPLI